MPELDDFDLKLLTLLQENSRLTGKELGDRVGLSAAACLRRVQRLRESEVIEKEVAVISPKVLGQRLTLIVAVTMDHTLPDRDRRFREKMIAAPEVLNCHHVTGASDFILTVQVRDMEQYRNFTESHFYEPYIKRFDTAAVVDTVK